MRKRVVVWFFALSLLLVGCAVGPDYEQPTPPLPQQFTAEDQQIVNGKAVDITWWQSFEDPVLSRLILEAAEQNREILQAVSRINRSRAIAQQGFSELLPGARLRGDYQRSQASDARFPDESGEEALSQGVEAFEFEVFTGSIDASWEIDLFGRLRRELEARNAEYAQSIAELQDLVRILISDVATHYIALRGAQNRLAIARSNEALQKTSLELVQSKFTFGEVPELDLERAKTQLAQTQATIPPLENEIASRIHRLSVLLGMTPRALWSELVEDSVPPVPSYNGPVTIAEPDQLLRLRPDIRQAERALAAATARIGVATAELFPVITMNGSLGVEAPKFSLLDDGARIYSFGPTVTWSALDTGRLRQQIYAQEADAHAALMQYEQAVLQALEDVENSLAQFSAQKATLFRLESAYSSSQKAFELADYQYKEGALDFISVLDAQRTLLQVETELSQTKEDLSVAMVGVFRAFGGGWEAFELKQQEERLQQEVEAAPGEGEDSPQESGTQTQAESVSRL